MQYIPLGSLLVKIYDLFRKIVLLSYCSKFFFVSQDLVNAYNSNRSTLPELIVLYYGYEMLSILATLHQCGIIHADVKPDNFMLRDLR